MTSNSFSMFLSFARHRHLLSLPQPRSRFRQRPAMNEKIRPGEEEQPSQQYKISLHGIQADVICCSDFHFESPFLLHSFHYSRLKHEHKHSFHSFPLSSCHTFRLLPFYVPFHNRILCYSNSALNFRYHFRTLSALTAGLSSQAVHRSSL